MRKRKPFVLAAWRRTYVAVACLLSGCAGFAEIPPPAASDPSDLANQAEFLELRLMLASEFEDEAVERLRARVAADAPSEYRVLLAEALLARRDVQGALATLNDCIAREPGFVPALQQRARLNRLRGESGEAAKDLRAALALEPTNPGMLEDLGMLLLRSAGQARSWSEDSEARETVRELVSIYMRLLNVRRGAERIMPLLVLGSVHTQLGEHDKAIGFAREAVELRPQDIRGQLALAEACEAAGRPPEALEAYRQAMLIEPENATIRAKMADLIRLTGASGGLMGFYADLADSFPRVKEIQEAYGEELLAAGEWSKAAVLYAKALELWPDDTRLRAALLRAKFAAGGEAETEKLAAEIVSDPATSPEEVLALATSLRASGRRDGSIALLQALSARRPEDVRAGMQLASLQIEGGRTEDAIATLEALLAKKPDTFLAVAMLGGLRAERGEFEEAHRLYARAAEALPPQGRIDLVQLEADLYRREGKPEAAVRMLDDLLRETTPPPESALRLLLQIHETSRDFEAAHRAIDDFGRRAPAEAGPGLRRLEAYLLWKEHRYGEAIATLEKLLDADPTNFEIFSFLVETCIDAEQFEKAIGIVAARAGGFEERFEPEVRLIEARVHKGRGDHDRAVGILEALMAASPDDGRYCMIAGEYYHLAGRIDDAERVLRRAIELDPGNAEAYNSLGYFFAEAGVKLDEAEALVKKALEMSPDAGHMLDSLGWVYFQKGDYDRAVETLERAVLRMKDDPDAVVLEHLGDAHARRGDAARARELYQAAHELDPDNETVKGKLGL